MKIFFVLIQIVGISIICYSQYSNGEKSKFEYGDAIYRNGAFDHGHTAIYAGILTINQNISLQIFQTLGYDFLIVGGDNNNTISLVSPN